jgi:hypothetical protein
MGMDCLVTHLALFCNPGLNNQAVAAELEAFYSKKAAVTRTANARRIIAAGRLRDALLKIASAQVSDQTRSAALAGLRHTV